MNTNIEVLRGLVAKWRAKISADRRDVYHDALRDAYEVAADELDAALAAMAAQGEAEAFCDANCAWNDHDPKCQLWNRDPAPQQPEAQAGGEVTGVSAGPSGTVFYRATPPSAVPEGMVLVPRASIEKEIAALESPVGCYAGAVAKELRAMLAAAPEPKEGA